MGSGALDELPVILVVEDEPLIQSLVEEALGDGGFEPAVTSSGEEAVIREADNLASQSWNERMWSDGGPIDPSPTIDQAINGGFPWLEIECSRCQTPRDVDLAALPHVPTTCVHDLAGRLVCQKCKKAGKPKARAVSSNAAGQNPGR